MWVRICNRRVTGCEAQICESSQKQSSTSDAWPSAGLSVDYGDQRIPTGARGGLGAMCTGGGLLRGNNDSLLALRRADIAVRPSTALL
jgi:hypothetical protein